MYVKLTAWYVFSAMEIIGIKWTPKEDAEVERAIDKEIKSKKETSERKAVWRKEKKPETLIAVQERRDLTLTCNLI